MTLEEYEKVLEEKRKALQALKTEERKVGLDKEFESMQQLSSKKKGSDDIFIKLVKALPSEFLLNQVLWKDFVYLLSFSIYYLSFFSLLI